MAYAFSTTTEPTGFPLPKSVSVFWAALTGRMEGDWHLRRIAHLRGLSDAELSARGLRRDAVPAHVLQDKFCY